MNWLEQIDNDPRLSDGAKRVAKGLARCALPTSANYAVCEDIGLASASRMPISHIHDYRQELEYAGYLTKLFSGNGSTPVYRMGKP